MPSIPRTAAAGLLATSLLLVGCGSDSDGASDATTTEAEATETTEAPVTLNITDVWARQSPMGTSAGAVYMNITSPVDDALVGVSVSEDIAATAEIHETVMAQEGEMGDEGEGATETSMAQEGMDEDTTETTMAEDGGDTMTMQPVDAIELPEGTLVALEPGGYHIMLLDLVEPLEVGDTFEVVLTFEQAGDVTVTAEVREG